MTYFNQYNNEEKNNVFNNNLYGNDRYTSSLYGGEKNTTYRSDTYSDSGNGDINFQLMGSQNDTFGGGDGGNNGNGNFNNNNFDNNRRNGNGGKKKRTKHTALLIAVCIMASSASGFGGAMLANHYMLDSGTASTATSDNIDTSSANLESTGFKLEDATGSKMTVQEITQKAQNSVVEIKTEGASTDSWMQQYVTEGAGSGVIIKSNGYILTNNHVVENANKIYVTLKNKKKYEAKLVGTDSQTDLAVLKIDAKNLSAATLGNSGQLRVGDLAVAIGNPLGELGGTVTAGIISALDRELTIDGKTMSLLQTDSSINPGNSGGGLFNQYGQLVGIVVAKSSGSDVEGLGFAIPVNSASTVAKEIISKGYVSGRAYSGMTYVDKTDQDSGMSEYFSGDSSQYEDFFGDSEQGQNSFDGNQTLGIYIQSVEGASAKKAGFKAGDLVYSIDGKTIDSLDTLSSIISSHNAGDTIKYVIVRDYQKETISLKLDERKSK